VARRLSVSARASAGALALILVLAASVWAGPPTETLDQAVAAVNRLLEDPALKDQPPKLLEAIRKAVIGCFDVRYAASLALGREWQARTLAERDEFVELFGDLIEQAYVSRIAARASVQRGLAVRYLDESVAGDLATVTATIASREGGDIPLVYRMIRNGQHWSVYDVLIDGVSLVVNYRAQLLRTIRQSSYTTLVAMLKARFARTPSSPAPPTTAAAVVLAGVGASPANAAARADMNPAPAPERGDGARATRVTAASRPAGPDTAPGVASGESAPSVSYWLQMGAFTNHEAGEIASRLLEQSLPLAIDAVTASRAEELLLRVRVGPFADRAEAVERLRDLQARGYQPRIAHELD
jgi:phospholipid transport system substrate-binding protein